MYVSKLDPVVRLSWEIGRNQSHRAIMEAEGVRDQRQPPRGDGGIGSSSSSDKNDDDTITTDRPASGAGAGAGAGHDDEGTNATTGSSSSSPNVNSNAFQQAGADADADGNEIKYESDGDDALLRREERRISRLEAQEAQQEQQGGDGEEGNNNGQNEGDDTGNELDSGDASANPDQEDDELDDDEEAYAAILDPLHGYECPEPDCATADALPFPTLVKRFETLWAHKKRMGNKQRREQLLEYLLPRKLLDQHLKECSIYPLLRLILPDCDVARGHLGMKEKSIANAWAAAMGFSRESKPYKKLVKFMDPQYAGHTATGDLSLCVKEVVAERYPMSGSRLTVGQMNMLLDELQMINSGKSRGSGGGGGSSGGGNAAEGSAAHAWRTAGEDGTAESAQAPGQGRQDQAAARKAEKQRQKKTKAQRQAGWVEKLMKCNMSPIEHKWVVRILLGKLEIGLGKDPIFKHWHPYAADTHSANNNIKILAQKLADPEWIRRREEKDKLSNSNQMMEFDKMHTPMNKEPAGLGNTITPMLSNRSNHGMILGLIHKHHNEYLAGLEQLEKQGQEELNEELDIPRQLNSLSLKFPTFINEVKLDGERMIVHFKRGAVTMQTRQSNWYSNVYAPVIAPPLRKALAGYDVDCILDGEIIAWDDTKGEVIPFGNNRTVAKVRREYLRSKGLLDPRDMSHENEDLNVVSVGMGDAFIRSNKDNANILQVDNPGKSCWLKFVVFDCLYVGGPDASKLIRKACAHLTPPSSPDYERVSTMTESIIDLTGYHRRAILYEMITPQRNEIEHVEAVVVTSDGSCIEGEGLKDYFSGKIDPKYGHPLVTLDSIDCVKKNVVPNIAEIDEMRRSNRKDEEIDHERAMAMEKIYTRVVEEDCQEGLMVKDLYGNYLISQRKFWFKLKADYTKQGWASDIDVVVIGGGFATGMGRAGILSSWLVGCIDDSHEASSSADLKMMTLGRVSAGGTPSVNLKQLLKETGFVAATAENDVVHGKWFKCQNHGGGFPDFLSKKSYQRGKNGDFDGWKFDRDKYPDVWIHPKDSFVITVNAAEVCSSDDYQAGVTLRFPRMSRIRKEGRWKVGAGKDQWEDGDEKPVTDAITCKEAQDMYYDRDISRAARSSLNADSGSQSQTVDGTDEPKRCRFATAGQYKQRRKGRRGKRSTTLTQVGASAIPTQTTKLSKILDGYVFAVLEGTYKLKGGTLDAQEAADKGWYEEAAKVSHRDDVIEFFQKHGGTCVLTAGKGIDFVVGGEKTDVRVANYRRAIESAPLEILNGTTKKDDNLRQMMKMGVVRWAFVYSAVNEMLQEINKVKEDADLTSDEKKVATYQSARSIKEHKPELLHPRRFDYLVISRVAEQVLLESEDKYGIHLYEESSEIEFKRALEEVGNDKKRKADDDAADASDLARKMSRVRSSGAVPWQYQAFESFTKEERWVFGGDNQKLWPHHHSEGTAKISIRDGKIPPSSEKSPVIMYPDVFGSDYGLMEEEAALKDISGVEKSDRWGMVDPSDETGALASALPLAAAMGAQVTPHLHLGITHVLVEMSKHEQVRWRPGLKLSIFKDKEAGKALSYRLEELDDEEDFADRPGKPDVTLVSPEWVRKEWSKASIFDLDTTDDEA